VVCGENPLSDTVPYLLIGWVTLPLWFGMGFAVWRWSCQHPWCALQQLWHASAWGIGMLVGVAPTRVEGFLNESLFLLLLIWGVSYLLPDAKGRAVRQALQSGAHHAKAGFRLMGRAVVKGITARRAAKPKG